MNDREVFDALLEKHPTWIENIKIKERTEERIRMLEPYDVESIEELIQNVRAKTIEDICNVLSDEIWNRPKIKDDYMHNHCIRRCIALVKQMKGESKNV